MRPKPVHDLKIGEELFDMHYFGRKGWETPMPIAEPHKITSVIRIACPEASKLVDAILRPKLAEYNEKPWYTNKMLVVVSHPEHRDGAVVVQAAWAYDNRTFGLMEIEVQEPQEALAAG